MASEKEKGQREKIAKSKAAANQVELAETKGVSQTPPVFSAGNPSEKNEPIQMSPLHCDIPQNRNWHHLDVKKSGCIGSDIDGMHKVNKGKKGSLVIVAVFDTEVDVNHEDLKNKIWRNQGEIPGDGIDNDCNGYVDDVNGLNITNEESYARNKIYGHGTSSAGMIGAERGNGIGIDGIADNIQIMPISISYENNNREEGSLYGFSNGSNKLTIAEGIRYAVNHGAHVINMSFFGIIDDEETQKEIDEAVKYAEMNDVLMIRSAGNNGENIDNPNNLYPKAKREKSDGSGYEDVGGFLIVGASDYLRDVRTMAQHRASFTNLDDETYEGIQPLQAPNDEYGEKYVIHPESNYGKNTTHLIAPGNAGLTTYPPKIGEQEETNAENLRSGQIPSSISRQRDEYGPYSYTSMAASVVSGIGAEIRSHCPELSAKEVMEAMMKTVYKPSQSVFRPSGENNFNLTPIALGELIQSGGIINGKKAMEYAKKLAEEKKKKLSKKNNSGVEAKQSPPPIPF